MDSVYLGEFQTALEGNKKLKAMLEGIEKKLSISDIPKEIQALVEERETTRKNKDWKKADELRDKIESNGYTVLDTPDGPEIKRS